MNKLISKLLVLVCMGLLSASCLEKESESKSGNQNNFVLEGSGGN